MAFFSSLLKEPDRRSSDVQARRRDRLRQQGDTIGTIEDLVIVQYKAVSGVIVSVGGFLEIGDSYVLINPSSFAVSATGGTVKAYLRTTKQLKDAPMYTLKKG